MYYPRLVRLFYESLHKEGQNYVFTWDGINYHLTEELIGRIEDCNRNTVLVRTKAL